MVCALILQALRPSPVEKESVKLVHGKRKIWMNEKNGALRGQLYEAMVRGLSHCCGEVRNLCAVNLAYSVWLDESDWYVLGSRLAGLMFADGSDENLRKGCVRCFVEMLGLRVVNSDDSETDDKRQLLERIQALFMELGADGSVDPDLRMDALNGLCSMLSTVPSLFSNAAMVDRTFDMVGEGLKTASPDLAAVMQRLLLETVKEFYSFADAFISKAADLIDSGINSKDNRCQIIAMNFWYELALFEQRKHETARNACREFCARISERMSVILCNVLLRVDEFGAGDSKDCAPAMALLTLKAFYPLASQQVFLVVQQFFCDHVDAESWESVCAAVTSLRVLCEAPRIDVVKGFLMDSIKKLFDSKLQGEVHPLLRAESLRTLRAFAKVYPEHVPDEYFLGIVERMCDTAATVNGVCFSCFCRLLVDVAKVAPAAWNDRVLANCTAMLMGKVLMQVKDAGLAVCGVVQFASPSSHELVLSWIPDFTEKLQDPQLPIDAKLSLSLVIKAVADKLGSDFPEPARLCETLLNFMATGGLSEETLMCLSSLVLCGRKTLSPYLERIWDVTNRALAMENPTLVDVAYCTLGSAFTAFGNTTAGLMHDILDVVLSREVATERLAPYLKCIGCILQAVGSLVTDEHRDRILVLMKSTTDDVLVSAEEGDIDATLVRTVLHVYSMVFVGCSSPQTGARNEAFMRLLCKPVFAFARAFSGCSPLLRDNLLHELFLLLYTIGKSLGAQANIPLNSSKIKDVMKRAAASRNQQLASEAKFLMNYVENL